MRAARVAVLLGILAAGSVFALDEPSRIEIRAGDRVLTNRPNDPSAIHVLFLGNSLTYWNEMPWMLEKISSGSPAHIAAEFVGGSGKSLRQHWERGAALRAIRRRRWNFVVLQGQSTEADENPAEFLAFGRRLDAEIRRNGAKTVLFLTWPNRGKSPEGIVDAYRSLARATGAVVAPVGLAWQGLALRGRDLYDASGVHSNLAGSYLTACVLYARLTGRSPIGLPHRFDVHFEIPEFYRIDLERESLSDPEAREIQSAAWEAVRREKEGR
jgi:hypothetical protein